MARSGVCLFSLLDFLEVFVLVVGHSTPALSLAFMAENVRNLPLMLSAHEKKKKRTQLVGKSVSRCTTFKVRVSTSF